jgi:cytoskeletal protein CcmA (bactofilin family)
MHAKTLDPAPAAVFTPLAQEPSPPPRPKSVSMIAQGVAIQGDVLGDGELHLDGLLKGDIRVGKLVLGPNARVEGTVRAQAVEIHGRVTGAIFARQVRLHGTAQVVGDITYEQLGMETGAHFEGRSQKFPRPAPVAAAPAPSRPAAGHVPAMAVYPE